MTKAYQTLAALSERGLHHLIRQGGTYTKCGNYIRHNWTIVAYTEHLQICRLCVPTESEEEHNDDQS